MPDLVLEMHRRRVPIDHPRQSILPEHVGTPETQILWDWAHDMYWYYWWYSMSGARDSGTGGYGTLQTYTDIALRGNIAYNYGLGYAVRMTDVHNLYFNEFYQPASTADHALKKRVGGTLTTLGTEAVDIALYGNVIKLSVSGSTLKSFRVDMATPKITATDTSHASGHAALIDNYTGGSLVSAWHLFGLHARREPPSTPGCPALAVIEAETAEGQPHAPLLSSRLVEIVELTGLPDFLYTDAKKYIVLKAKGFTDDEIRTVFGDVQHQVDLDAVTWGAFEFSERAPTNIVMVYGDNPYKPGAVERQAAFAKSKGLRALKPPKDYGEAVEQFNALKKDFPYWLAGKDNYAYQTLGWEELDVFQNVDFYYGELVEHRTHYDQLKLVPELELWKRLEELEQALKRVTALAGERDKHLAKLKELEKKGW